MSFPGVVVIVARPGGFVNRVRAKFLHISVFFVTLPRPPYPIGWRETQETAVPPGHAAVQTAMWEDVSKGMGRGWERMGLVDRLVYG